MISMNEGNNIKTLFWNCNGLRERKQETEEIIHRMKLDIIMISETHLKSGSKIKFINYTMYRCDRTESRGGGVAILVKKNIQHSQVRFDDLCSIEAIGVTINIPNQGKVTFASVYKSPNNPLLSNDLDIIFNSCDSVIVCGDLNCKSPLWNSTCTNPNGKILEEYLSKKELIVLGPTSPTHFSTYGSFDVLDISILKNVCCPSSIESLCELSSDHNPVLLELKCTPECNETLVKFTNWVAFQEQLDKSISCSSMFSSIDTMVSHLETVVISSLEKATNTTKRKKFELVIPVALQELIRERRRQRRISMTTLCPKDKKYYNWLNTKVKRELSSLYNSRWESKLKSLRVSDKSLWKITKSLKSTRSNPSSVSHNNVLYYSDSDKANVFSEYLNNSNTPSNDHSDINFISLFVKDSLSSPSSCDVCIDSKEVKSH